MSRSDYTDAIEDPLEYGRWRAAVKSAIQGKRGQVLLRDLVGALDAMEDKRLYADNFATADGEFCTFGVLGAKRGTKIDDLGDEEYCDADEVARRFDIAPAMAREVMFKNDSCTDTEDWINVEICGPVRPYWPDYGSHTKRVRMYNDNHPHQRWQRMRAWAEGKLIARGT